MAKASKKASLCEKVYVGKDGSEYKTLPEDPSTITHRLFRFADGTTRELGVKDFPKPMIHGAILTGLGYVGSAALNGAETVEDAIEQFDRRIKTLMSGKWSDRPAGSGGGGRDSAVVAAIFAAAEEAGRKVDEGKVRAYMLAEDVDDGTDGDANMEKVRGARRDRRAAWLKNADVARHYERIKAERQAEKAAKIAAAAPAESAELDWDAVA